MLQVLTRLSNAYALQGDSKRHEHTEESISRLQSLLEERTIASQEPEPFTPLSAGEPSYSMDETARMAAALSSLELQIQDLEGQALWKDVIRVGRQIINIRDHHFSSNRGATLRTLRLLATAHEKLDQYADAKALWRRILESQGDSLPKAQHVETLRHLVSCCDSLKSYTDLEGALEELLDLQLSDEDASREAIEETVSHLRTTYEKTGRHHEIEHLLKRLLDNSRERQRPQVICADIDRLATYYGDYGESSKAERCLNLLLEGQKVLYGANHVSTVRTMRRLLSLLVHMGREEEAAQLRRSIDSIMLSNNTTDRTDSLKEVVEADIRESRITEALAGLSMLLRARNEVSGPEGIETLEWIANTYETMERYDSAAPLWRDVLQTLRQDGDARKPDIRNALGRLARNCELRGRYAEAVIELLQLLDMAAPDDHEGQTSIMSRIAEDYESCSDWTAAEKMREMVVDATRKKVGITHDSYWSALCKLLTVRLSQGKPQEAWTPLITYLSRLLLRDRHNREAYLLLVDICRGLGQDEARSMWKKTIMKEYSYSQVSMVTGVSSHIQRLGSPAIVQVVAPLMNGYCDVLGASITTAVSPKIDDGVVKALILGAEVLDRAYEACDENAPVLRLWSIILAAKTTRERLELATACDTASRFASAEIVLQSIVDNARSDDPITSSDLASRISSIQSRRSLRDEDLRAWTNFDAASNEGDVEVQRAYLRDSIFKARVDRLIKSHRSHGNTDAALQKLNILSSVQRSVLGVSNADTLHTIDQTLQMCKEEGRFQDAEQLLRQCKGSAEREGGGAFFAIAVREAKVRQWTVEAS